jgi:hypothetical protein
METGEREGKNDPPLLFLRIKNRNSLTLSLVTRTKQSFMALADFFFLALDRPSLSL